MQITIQEAIIQLQKALVNQRAYTSQDAWWLLEHITHKKYPQLILLKNEPLSLQQMMTFKEIFNDIKNEKPLAYIIGWIPFLNLTIHTKPPILIPRSETEYWCNELLVQLKRLPDHQHIPLRILDMCTGSGCIALALAKFLPNAHVTAVDNNPVACELTQQNAKENNIHNVTVIESDLFTKLHDQQFDIIVSNPPYIDPAEFDFLDNSVKNWEDSKALIADDTGFALIKDIITHARNALKYNEVLSNAAIPQLWIEIGHEQGSSTKLLMEKAAFCKVAIMKDIYHKDRFVTALLPD